MKPYQSLKIGSPEYQKTHRARKFPNGQVNIQNLLTTVIDFVCLGEKAIISMSE